MENHCRSLSWGYNHEFPDCFTKLPQGKSTICPQCLQCSTSRAKILIMSQSSPMFFHMFSIDFPHVFHRCSPCLHRHSCPIFQAVTTGRPSDDSKSCGAAAASCSASSWRRSSWLFISSSGDRYNPYDQSDPYVCMPWSWIHIYHQYTPVLLAYIYIPYDWIRHGYYQYGTFRIQNMEVR